MVRWLYDNNVACSIREWWSFTRCINKIESLAAARELRLHLGCGPHIIEGWVNVDAKTRPGVLTATMPRGLRRFGAGCADYIYTSHFLEHLEYPDEAGLFVRECWRILRPGGVLRIVVPGIQKIIEAYFVDDQDFFKIQARFHPEECTTKMEHLLYALQQHGEHKYGYDFETCQKLLIASGFSKAILSDFNTSEFLQLRVDYRMHQDNQGRYLSLFVDAVK
jgi:predicted SAM-dependent methyltransferase